MNMRISEIREVRFGMLMREERVDERTDGGRRARV